MDGSTMSRTSNWDRAKMTALWIKDHAPAFTISTVTFSALWVAVVLCWFTLYAWDSTFYKNQASPGNELTFWTAGIVFRTFVIFGGLAIIWIKQNYVRRTTEEAKFLWVKYQRPVGTNFFGKAALTLRIIWIMGLIACGVAAMGFVTEGHDYHYRAADAITTTAEASTTSADDTIKRAQAEKDAIRKDRDGLVSAARTSMNLVLDDGNARNDDVSQYEANIAKYQTEAQTKLDAQDAVIAKAEAEKLTAKQSATAEAVGDPALAAVYRFPARYIGGFDGVGFRDGFGLFWVVLIELCGSVGAQAVLAVQMALSKRKQAQEAGSRGGRTTSRRRLIEDMRKARREATKADLDEESVEEENEDGDNASPKQAAE
jgi:hypothetical protein